MNKKRTSKKGFIALFIVMLVGFLAGFFVVASAPRVWLQSKDVALAQVAASARFNAISCIDIARLKIFLGESPDRSKYYLTDGSCGVEIISRRGERIILQTDAAKGGVEILLQAELNAETLEIISIREF